MAFTRGNNGLRVRAEAAALTALLALSAGAIGCKGGGGGPSSDGGRIDRPGTDGNPSCSGSGTGSKGNGEACSCGTECGSGFCADGVCCNVACTETCMSCGLATSLGMCTAIPAGVKPRLDGECPIDDKSTCGHDGTCDGAGKCRSYESGTICKAGTCESDAITGMYTCDGAGKCKLGASTVCAPFSCNRSTNLCFSGCSSDADCVSGRKCVNGSCGLKMLGAVCKQDGECASAHCVKASAGAAEGLCCNTACSGACRVCNLPDRMGTCSPVPSGQGHPMCTMQAVATCGTTGVCDGFGTCLNYPSNSPCGAATCASATSVNTARTCDGLGTCQTPEVRDCGNYRCANGACNTRCTTNNDCAPGIACVNNSCGTRVDGQPCTANSDCQNQHCVNDGPGTPGICCNTTCTGPCKSCALAGMEGRCTNVAAGAADPRKTCTDLTAAMCSTDGKCDGAGACRRYPSGTTCAAETCVSDVYTGPSTCNASGQCVKPAALPCNPYHCNATKCFSACTASNVECIPPAVCGMNGMISSCGLKPPGASCSSGSECNTSICAQGVCCTTACGAPCTACNLNGSMGTCTNVASGPDPQGMCAAQAMNTCGTTGQCAAGQCARYAAGTQCAAATCPTASTRTPPAMCNGTGLCVTPANTNCAPGRCDTTMLACVNTCTTDAQCTAPATCVNGSCGLKVAGNTCTANNQCMSGNCYLDEGAPGVCCTSACNGTCETCRNSTGTCTAIAAGVADPDPATACVAAPGTCGLNGRCAGNNTGTNAAGTARCQFFDTTQGCRSRSCTPGNATTPAMETAAATCNGSGACSTAVTTSCGLYKTCDATNPWQCATTCTGDADCVGVTCNLKTSQCGQKLGVGSACIVGTDCLSGNCVDGVCCDSACTGTCMACNNSGQLGTCSAVATGTADALCSTTPATPVCMTNTGLCAAGGTCAKVGSSTTCAAATCSADGFSRIPAGACNGAGACVVPAATACTPGHCSAGTCTNTCTAGTQATDCTAPNTCVSGTCGLQPLGGPCMAANQCVGTAGGCVNNACCTTASCSGPTCSGNMLTPAGSCSSGTCSAPAAAPCANSFTCADGTSCRTSCTLDTHCANGMKCNTSTGQCTGRPAGQACSVTGDCAASLTCVDMVCCTTATCPAASCNMTNNMFTPASQCQAVSGTCSTPAATMCAGTAMACADAFSCAP